MSASIDIPSGTQPARTRPSWADGICVGPGVEPEEFWERHGASLYALACVLLGHRPSALRAVALAMMDLFTPSELDPQTAPQDMLRSAARCVLRRCQQMLTEPPQLRTMTAPPVIVLLGEVADLQRQALALAVFGGHSYREVAEVLDLTPEAVAGLLSAGLRELGVLASGPPGQSQ